MKISDVVSRPALRQVISKEFLYNVNLYITPETSSALITRNLNKQILIMFSFASYKQLIALCIMKRDNS